VKENAVIAGFDKVSITIFVAYLMPLALQFLPNERPPEYEEVLTIELKSLV
jgi:hypothetical protein